NEITNGSADQRTANDQVAPERSTFGVARVGVPEDAEEHPAEQPAQCAVDRIEVNLDEQRHGLGSRRNEELPSFVMIACAECNGETFSGALSVRRAATYPERDTSCFPSL